jgi:hypothetical protein
VKLPQMRMHMECTHLTTRKAKCPGAWWGCLPQSVSPCPWSLAWHTVISGPRRRTLPPPGWLPTWLCWQQKKPIHVVLAGLEVTQLALLLSPVADRHAPPRPHIEGSALAAGVVTRHLAEYFLIRKARALLTCSDQPLTCLRRPLASTVVRWRLPRSSLS